MVDIGRMGALLTMGFFLLSPPFFGPLTGFFPPFLFFLFTVGLEPDMIPLRPKSRRRLQMLSFFFSHLFLFFFSEIDGEHSLIAQQK